MAFNVIYNAGGDIDNVRYVKRIHGMAQELTPYHDMSYMSITAPGTYTLSLTLPNEQIELYEYSIYAIGCNQSDTAKIFLDDLQILNTGYPYSANGRIVVNTRPYVYIAQADAILSVEYTTVSESPIYLYISCSGFTIGEGESPPPKDIPVQSIIVTGPDIAYIGEAPPTVLVDSITVIGPDEARLTAVSE